jgi:hypothetical protein
LSLPTRKQLKRRKRKPSPRKSAGAKGGAVEEARGVIADALFDFVKLKHLVVVDGNDAELQKIPASRARAIQEAWDVLNPQPHEKPQAGKDVG